MWRFLELYHGRYTNSQVDCPAQTLYFLKIVTSMSSAETGRRLHVQARSQPARWGGGSELGWVDHQAHPPPLGHCPRDVINLKNAPTLGHSQAPPPLDIARVTSSTYSKGGTKLLKGGTKLLKGGTKLLKGGTKLLKGGTKLLKGGTKLLKGGTKSLGWATGGGRTTPPRPPPPPWLRA